MGTSVSRSGGRGRMRALAEINVTPLVDVMLVLLIISMLAAPMLQRGIPLELPKTETSQDIPEARIVISMDRDMRIKINDRPVHYDLIEDTMAVLAQQRPDEIVYIRADRTLQYGDVLLLMDRVRKAGFHRVALVTVPLKVAEQRR